VTAYLIAVETIHDEAMFVEYRKQVVATVEAFGGRSQPSAASTIVGIKTNAEIATNRPVAMHLMGFLLSLI
jgi:uncharacterized protein (DUF1330 family)